MARRDEFLKRDTLSLFGDDSRSDCTVAEAKAFEKNQSKSRRKLAMVIVIPVLLLIVGGGLGYWWHENAARKAYLEAEREAEMNPKLSDSAIGVESAKLVIEIQGPDEEMMPPTISLVKHALFLKPSEVLLKQVYGGSKTKPVDYKLVINGKENIDVKNDAGEVVTLNLSDPGIDMNLLAKCICQEWNALYPDAQHPLVLEAPKREVEEKPATDEENPAERFKNIPLANDPRMER